MSRISNFIVLSFALLSDGEKVMSVKGNHTFGIVSGKEDYDVLKVSCKDLFREINELVEQGEIEVDNHKIPLEFYLSGDYKFLLLVLGMNGAMAHYACIYCKIHKDARWDTSKPEEYYWSDDIKRTLAENKQLADKSTNNYGCKQQPLLNIPIENIRVDELHLFLRVTDILERNIINNALEQDLKENMNKPPSARKNTRLSKIVEAINNCGVSFSVWEKRNADGKGSGLHEWTSMVGNEKKKVISSLPEKFPEILDAKHCDTICQIWKDFHELYQIFSAWQPCKTLVDSFFGKAKEWINLYLSLSGEVPGHQKPSITPYLHVLVYHVPQFLKDENCLKSFTGQGVEKTNDIVRSIYHNKSNRHDACKEAMLALKRIDHLQEYERTPHKYTKQSNDYWNSGIYEQRRKKLRLCVDVREEPEVPMTEVDIDNMSLKDIKDKLKELNIKTRVRRMDKLREILKSYIQQPSTQES